MHHDREFPPPPRQSKGGLARRIWIAGIISGCSLAFLAAAVMGGNLRFVWLGSVFLVALAASYSLWVALAFIDGEHRDGQAHPGAAIEDPPENLLGP